jgi:hypothetical protein
VALVLRHQIQLHHVNLVCPVWFNPKQQTRRTTVVVHAQWGMVIQQQKYHFVIFAPTARNNFQTRDLMPRAPHVKKAPTLKTAVRNACNANPENFKMSPSLALSLQAVNFVV